MLLLSINSFTLCMTSSIIKYDHYLVKEVVTTSQSRGYHHWLLSITQAPLLWYVLFVVTAVGLFSFWGHFLNFDHIAQMKTDLTWSKKVLIVTNSIYWYFLDQAHLLEDRWVIMYFLILCKANVEVEYRPTYLKYKKEQ